MLFALDAYFKKIIEINRSNMNKITTILLSLTAIGVMSSCGNQKKKDQEQEKNLFSESMLLHDEVMPKQEELFKLKKKISGLGAKMDSLKIANPTLDTAALRIKINGLSTKIDSAVDNMSDWMHSFTSDLDQKFEGKSHEEIMKYLNDGKQSIENVQKEFNQSISDANKFLNEYKVK
ncbi:hypothetical protein D3C80_460980 [compost metagenome]